MPDCKGNLMAAVRRDDDVAISRVVQVQVYGRNRRSSACRSPPSKSVIVSAATDHEGIIATVAGQGIAYRCRRSSVSLPPPPFRCVVAAAPVDDISSPIVTGQTVVKFMSTQWIFATAELTLEPMIFSNICSVCLLWHSYPFHHPLGIFHHQGSEQRDAPSAQLRSTIHGFSGTFV